MPVLDLEFFEFVCEVVPRFLDSLPDLRKKVILRSDNFEPISLELESDVEWYPDARSQLGEDV